LLHRGVGGIIDSGGALCSAPNGRPRRRPWESEMMVLPDVSMASPISHVSRTAICRGSGWSLTLAQLFAVCRLDPPHRTRTSLPPKSCRTEANPIDEFCYKAGDLILSTFTIGHRVGRHGDLTVGLAFLQANDLRRTVDRSSDRFDCETCHVSSWIVSSIPNQRSW
jgi:hypothetical protein